MSDPIGRSAQSAIRRAAEPPSRPAALSPQAKLKQASHDLEGLFVNELFKAMRSTVPQDGGILGSAPGQDLFQGMMDEKLSAIYAGKSQHGIGDALYRQLSRRLAGGSQP